MKTAPRSMFAWIFAPDTPLDRFLRLGVGGTFATIVVSTIFDKVDKFVPSDVAQFLVSLAVALLIMLPQFFFAPPRDRAFQWPSLTIGCAYAIIAILYFLKIMGFAPASAGYNTGTDVVGTLVFIIAWFMLSVYDRDKQSQIAERVVLVILLSGLLVSGGWKYAIEMQTSVDNISDQVARLLLNCCNGAVFLSLYAQMRRILPSPDPISHTLILLYGCAQIPAHGRDCLTAHPACTLETAAGIGAYSIAWLLLLGKIAFGLYVSYCYFEATPSKSE